MSSATAAVASLIEALWMKAFRQNAWNLKNKLRRAVRILNALPTDRSFIAHPFFKDTGINIWTRKVSAYVNAVFLSVERQRHWH